MAIALFYPSLKLRFAWRSASLVEFELEWKAKAVQHRAQQICTWGV
jgi:hypothetical protein